MSKDNAAQNHEGDASRIARNAEDAHLLSDDELTPVAEDINPIEFARGSVDEDGDKHLYSGGAVAESTTPPESTTTTTPKKDNETVSWSALPHKRQLAILTAARLSEPLVQTSLQAYMFFQLKSFDPSLSDGVIAKQAGALAASFTGAQFATAMLWGRMSDSETFGRKTVLMIGLVGTLVSCIGFGFSKAFWQAMIFRTLGGALNGNVGVMRTMISEIIREKKYQSRAFLLLPMCFNIGVIIGPILGGLLADPANSYPSLFGGIKFFEVFPYALPNLVSSIFLFMSAGAVFFGLEETHEALRHKEDFGTRCGRIIAQAWRKLRHVHDPQYTRLEGDESSVHDSRISNDVELGATPEPKRRRVAPKYPEKLPFRRIFTPNVLCTLLAYMLMSTHITTFNNLWFVFLSTPVSDPANPDPPDYKQRLPFKFTGGIGMPSRDVGLALAILGFIGIAMQLFLYPPITSKLGTLRSYKLFLAFFPVAYFVAPFLSLIPSRTPPPAEKDGILIWLGIIGVLSIQVIARTFALPANVILVNNCVPHPTVLGTVHGIGQSASSATRTLGPLIGGWLYDIGLRNGMIGLSWWSLSSIAILGFLSSSLVKEGDGHEIRLPGDDLAEAEAEAENARL